MCVSGLVVTALLCASIAPALSVSPSDVFTTLDYEAAFEKAKADDLLLIVDATAEWCGPCKRMERETWSKAEVVEALAGVALPIQIDVDEQRDLAQRLKIGAMPTIIAIRDGKEVDRHVGYLGPDDFLKWFDAVREGVSLTDLGRQAALEQDAALLASSDESARYQQAGELAGFGEYDRALTHYLWLWKNIGRGSSMLGVRSSFMLAEMARLARKHPPATKAFGDLQDALFERVEADPLTLSAREWNDWMKLSAHLERSLQVLQWFDSIGAGDGRLSSEIVSASARPRLEKELMDLMIEQGRLVDAAGLGADLEKRASDLLAAYKMVQSSGQLDMLPTDIREQMVRTGQQRLRNQLALLHTVAMLASDADDAEHIAGRLLDYLDDADSRIELVSTAIDAGVPPTDQFSAWLDEAAELGEPVDALRKKLRQVGG
jgi:thiol-disulfide isomerase/thioredoxin